MISNFQREKALKFAKFLRLKSNVKKIKMGDLILTQNLKTPLWPTNRNGCHALISLQNDRAAPKICGQNPSFLSIVQCLKT